MHLRIWLVSLGLATMIVASSPAQEPGAAADSGQSKEEPATEAPAAEAEGNGQSGEAKTEPATSDPDWFNKMLARTIDPLPPIAVTSADGYFTASIPAKMLKSPESVEDLYLLTVDFGPGADSAAQCYVFRRDLDLAGSMMLFSDDFFGAIARSWGAIKSRAIYAVDAGGIGSVPYLGLDWLFRSQAEGAEPLVGQAKHLIASKAGRALYCQNSAVGYDDAFFNLFRSLVATIKFSAEPVAEPYYHDLHLATVGEQVVGVSLETHRIDSDGDIEVKVTTSMLIPADQETLRSSDSVSAEFSTLSGELISKLEVNARVNEVETQLSLSQDEAGEWQVRGTFEGQELSANLGTQKVQSELEQRLAIRRLGQEGKKDDVATFSEWLPGPNDPAQIVETKIVHFGQLEKGLSLRVESGAMTYTAVANHNMSFISRNIPIGPVAVIFEQIFERGDAFYPLILAAEQ